jgi:hypothetical protein
MIGGEWNRHIAGMQRRGAVGWVVATSMASLVLAAQSGDPAAIQQRLTSQIKITTTTADRSDIVTAGTIVQLHKPGLVMYAVSSPLPPSNTYKNGRIGQGWSGFGKDIAIGMRASDGTTANDYQHRPFVAEEKCWVTSIEMQKDGVLFQLYSDPYNDVRYYASLKIPFADKKSVPPADAFLQTVAEVLTAVPSDDQGAQSNQPAPPAPARMQAIAPPPPPADSPPPTIAIGQTRDQVTAAFGQPVRIAKLGVKEIYYYKDMKVTFTNGKVSNVD